MTIPTGHLGTEPAKPRPAWQVGAATIAGFVAVLYLIELIDTVAGHRLDYHGIAPMSADGLWGIAFAPLLHANWAHLIANTIPLLVLGFLPTLSGMARFVSATAVIWVLGGFGTWLIGDVGPCPGSSIHIGASGLIFGWLTFLLVFGWFSRRPWEIIVSVPVLVGYGSVLWGAVPVLNRCGGVSWQAHLCGAMAGVVAAYLLSGPERKARAERRAVRG